MDDMLKNFLRRGPQEVFQGEIYYLMQEMAVRIIELEKKLAEKDE